MRYSTLMRAMVAFALSIEGQGVSTDARCGQQGNGATCKGSRWGNCCSQYDYCGSTDAYCGVGCQSGFGTCNYLSASSQHSSVSTTQSSQVVQSSTSSIRSSASSSPSQQPVSQNARCGANYGGQTCYGSKWGDCCSKYFYCGSTDDYCLPDSCQVGYGKCSPSSASSSVATQSSVTSSPASSVLSSSSSLSPTSCIPQASSCKNLPAASTASCMSVIHKSKLRLATCEQVGGTTTSTLTITQLGSAVTTTITSTTTSGVTIQSTAVVTSTSTSLATATATITVGATVASVLSTTVTTKVTVSSPYASQESVCTRTSLVPRGVRQQSALASDCSCFLTTTNYGDVTTNYATATSTVLPSVVTTTTYTTVTVNVIQTIQQTESALASSTIIVTDTATATLTQVSTVTLSTSTATSTSFAGFCSTFVPLTGIPSIRNGGQATLGGYGDGYSTSQCCNNCAINSNCVYYGYDSTRQLCYYYFTNRAAGTPSNACSSAKCSYGVQNFDQAITSGTTQYFGGPCLAASPGGN